MLATASSMEVTFSWWQGWPNFRKMQIFDTTDWVFSDGDWTPMIEVTAATDGNVCLYHCLQVYMGVISTLWESEDRAAAVHCSEQQSGQKYCFGNETSNAPGDSDIDPLRFVILQHRYIHDPGQPTFQMVTPDATAVVGSRGTFFDVPISATWAAGGSDANYNRWEVVSSFFARPTVPYSGANLSQVLCSGSSGGTPYIFDIEMQRCRAPNEIGLRLGTGFDADGVALGTSVFTDLRSMTQDATALTYLAEIRAMRPGDRRRLDGADTQCFFQCDPGSGSWPYLLEVSQHAACSTSDGTEALFCVPMVATDSMHMQFCLIQVEVGGEMRRQVIVDPDISTGDNVNIQGLSWTVTASFWAESVGQPPSCLEPMVFDASLKRCKFATEVAYPVGYYARTEYRTFIFPYENFAWPNSGWEYLTGWVATNTPGEMGHNKCFHICLKTSPWWRMLLKQTLQDKEDDNHPDTGCDLQNSATMAPMCVADNPISSAYRRFVVGNVLYGDTDWTFYWMTDDYDVGVRVYDPPTRVADEASDETQDRELNSWEVVDVFYARPMPGGNGGYLPCWGGYYEDPAGQGEVGRCLRCPLGKFRDITQYTYDQCFNCPTNSSTSLDTRLRGESCICDSGMQMVGDLAVSGGDFTVLNNAQCQQCESGTYGPPGTSTCLDCQAGKFSSENGTSSCDNCVPGSFQNDTKATDCDECIAGKVTPIAGLSTCVPCTAGMAQAAPAQVACRPCTQGFFSSGLGAEECEICPSGMTTTGNGADNSLNCVCEQGTYFPCLGMDCLLHTPATECAACPRGMVCRGPNSAPWAMISDDGRSHRLPFVPQGYMAIDSKVYKCAGVGEACPGAFMGSPDEDMCAYGGSSIACSLCPRGSRFDGDKCTECGEFGTLGVIAFFIIVIGVLGSLFLGSRPLEKEGKFTMISVDKMRHRSVLNQNLAILINLMQTTWIITRFDIGMPQGTKQTLFVLGSIFDLSAFQLDCLGSDTDPRVFAVTRTIMCNMAPAIIIAWMGLTVLAGKLCKRDGMPKPVYAINSLVGLFAAFFMAIANAAINDGFAMYDHPSGDRSLKSFPYLLTSSSEASAVQVVSVFGIIIWCVGGLAMATFVQLNLANRREDKAFRQCCVSMVIKYRWDQPWWYLVTLFTSLLITLSVSIIQDGDWQMVYMLLILLAYFGGLLSFKPYYSWLVYYADVVASAGKIALLIACLPYQKAAVQPGASAANFIPAVAIIVYLLVIFQVLLVLVVFLQFRFAGKIANLESLMADLGSKFTKNFPKAGDLEEVCDDKEEAMAMRDSRRKSSRQSKQAEEQDPVTVRVSV